MKRCLLLVCSLVLLSAARLKAAPEDHPTLPIGALAPDFSLPGIDGTTYTLASFAASPVLVIIFTCNHCPTAQAYEDRIIRLTADYTPKGVSVVAVMPNDPSAVRLDELGYTDLGDSFEDMQRRARDKQFNFPYLYDGETESMSKAYGPVATPHVFIFDAARRLRYRGRIDDVEKPTGVPKHHDTRNAIEALLQGKPVPVETTKVFGCSIKWAEKSNWTEQALIAWSKEPVSLGLVDAKGTRDIISNNSGKLRLINIWATWCGPCVKEFPSFIEMYHMYRGRDFELVTISADEEEQHAKALAFLKNNMASCTNYRFSGTDKYALIEAVDPNWQGALPYTIIVEPGGAIVYAKQGIIDPYAIKKAIVENRYIGRYY